MVFYYCHAQGDKQDVCEIYIADSNFYVPCALHLYFELKSLNDYFLKEFRLSWGRLKIMSAG